MALIVLIFIQNLKHSFISKQSLLEEKINQLADNKLHLHNLLNEQRESNEKHRQSFDEHQINSLKTIQESLHLSAKELRQQINSSLSQNQDQMNKQFKLLSETTGQRLKDISQEVNKQLAEGFEKTNTTFHDINKRLIIIDQAQQKITELSTNVVSLQEILSDKKSRGAFGEVQLAALIRNMIPEQHFSMQHTLSNGKRADCVLFLPEPTGNVVVDSKFPLESYKRLQVDNSTANQQQFRKDIKKHIIDIAEKYILPNETADGAMMFIPAEAIFSEIHSHYSDLIELSHKHRVWLVSPTTMMAILTTARAVLKDAATQKQVHIIKEHLTLLGADFQRFQKRMDNLARHINQANEDIDLVHKSSKKITQRFNKIEQVDIDSAALEATVSPLE